MNIGFIGSGNMASALANGFLASKTVLPQNLCISDKSAQSLEKWNSSGVKTTSDNVEVCNFADVIIYAVKPNILPVVLEETKAAVAGKLVVSIAAGVTLKTIAKTLSADVRIIRAMPNTPAQVGCGMTVLSPWTGVSETELSIVKNIFSGAGEVCVLDEKYINAATALHGSSPAYVYMLIDAMANSGVKHGIPKDISLRLAAKAVEGSAKMVLETQRHPAELRDAVCSPGGTTIEAVIALEECGFSSAVANAIDACVEKANEMSEK